LIDLQRAKETVDSDNFILEFKKKDLLKLTTDLEEAYEEITKQTNQLKIAHHQILEKNKELELGKEALLDQTDYLHEANETISQMHAEVQKQREEILKKNEELLSLNNEKNNLIGIVAHDLKSPLNQIKGLVSLVRITGKPDKETEKFIDMMESSLNKLTNMIGKILDVEAIESKKLNLHIERTDLSELVRAVLARFKSEAEQKKIVLHDQIARNIYAHVDKDYADQVFQNLVSNAIKFSPVERNIFVSLTVRDKKVISEVRDEGPGLSEEDKKKLFGKYQKLSARPTGNETSTGLGLSIVKKFVENMHGEIWCESEEGKGASFFVMFGEA
jgi:signal transduction histidine kinase